MHVEFSNHFKSFKVGIESNLLNFLEFSGNLIHLAGLIVLTLVTIKRSQLAMTHLSIYIISIVCNINKLIIVFLEMTRLTEFTLYRDISIVNSCFTIAVCFFSFFTLTVRKSPMDGMTMIKSKFENS
jgi:hypothetical protein